MDRRESAADPPFPGLVAGFAHGVRNPLNLLLLSLQFLERLVAREPDPARRADLEPRVRAAAAEAGRIERMVAAFVETAAPLEPALETVDLGRIAELAVADAGGAAAVEVRGRPLEVEADPRLLREAIGALVRNAVEAGGRVGPIEVDIETPAAPGTARVVVRDRGPGFGEAALARVPELFLTTKPGRLGTGLVRAARTAGAHGGRLEVRNRPGGGAEVAIVIRGRAELP
jgi:two-component system sensor histidine kinase MprB